MELEWVFFSVTPTSIKASRIALLFTSSSRAKSLIRTLLIRPFIFNRSGYRQIFMKNLWSGALATRLIIP
jgi:ABC-type sugar transport system permease subunit